MFFGLTPVDNHPCCKMQEVVIDFFKNSIPTGTHFTDNIFPEWSRDRLIRDRPKDTRDTLYLKFKEVFDLLHKNGCDEAQRQKIYDQVCQTNNIQDLCNGSIKITSDAICWTSDLGIAIKALMDKLYESLDSVAFKRAKDQIKTPTQDLYENFIKKNVTVCPFCGLSSYKNKHDKKREDFDHYLNKARYPFVAANLKNLVPTCATCNQGHKQAQDTLADGFAFYPYEPIPEIEVEIECKSYPAINDDSDEGDWEVRLTPVESNLNIEAKIKTWDRLYSIKTRLENEIKQDYDEWMKQSWDGYSQQMDENEFRDRLRSEIQRANKRALRRREAKCIIKHAFYKFMLNKAAPTFFKSFLIAQNKDCSN